MFYRVLEGRRRYLTCDPTSPLADPGGGGGGTEAMASPKCQTREAKLCFGLPKPASGFNYSIQNQLILLVLLPKKSDNTLGIGEAPQLHDESGPRRIDHGPEGRIGARRTNQGPIRTDQGPPKQGPG